MKTAIPSLSEVEPYPRAVYECNPDLVYNLIDLPEYENEVTDVHPQEPYECTRGTITKKLVEMSDGTLYPCVTGMPRGTNLKSDTAVVFTTAWLTSTKGHNSRTLMRMMKAGYPVVMIGPEGEETNQDICIAERFKLAATNSLYKISHDMNRILDEILPGMDVRQDEIITLGESRGAMEAPGFNIPQYSGNRTVVYGDHTAPCFARPPKVHELPGAALQLVDEVKVLGNLALQLPFQGRGKHYAATMHTNGEYYAKETFKLFQLMSGQAGSLAKAARAGTPMHVRIFKGDRWSQLDEWRRIYACETDVAIEATHGVHLNIADNETLDGIEMRLNAIAEARGIDGSFESVNFSPIIALHNERRRRWRKKPAIAQPVPQAA